MEQIIFKNSAGKTVTLGDDAPFILTKIDGTGAVDTNIYTQKSPNQDGVSYQGNTLGPRPISLEVKILAENEDDMAIKRGQLLNIFNPKLEKGELTYRLGNITRKVSALPELAPVFPENNRVFKDTMQDCLIQLYCPNPYWQDITESTREIITWTGGMRFPLRLPTSFAMAGEKLINIVNDGDVETPVKLEIFGPATNPKVTKRGTGEFLRLKSFLEAGDVVTITTEFGNKRVELNGENAFNALDLPASKFFNLDVGDNVIIFTTENIDDNANIRISFRNKFLGV